MASSEPLWVIIQWLSDGSYTLLPAEHNSFADLDIFNVRIGSEINVPYNGEHRSRAVILARGDRAMMDAMMAVLVRSRRTDGKVRAAQSPSPQASPVKRGKRPHPNSSASFFQSDDETDSSPSLPNHSRFSEFRRPAAPQRSVNATPIRPLSSAPVAPSSCKLIYL